MEPELAGRRLSPLGGEESPDFIEHSARRKPGRGDPTESATETNRWGGRWALGVGRWESILRPNAQRPAPGKGEMVR